MDSRHKDMHGIFYAKGPAFKNDYEIPALKVFMYIRKSANC